MVTLEAAMAGMERARGAFEAAAHKVLAALEELQSDVLAANLKMQATKMELVTTARKRQRRSGARNGTHVAMPHTEPPDEQAFASLKLPGSAGFRGRKHMGSLARSLGLARVTHVVGGYGFGSPHSLGGAIPTR